MDKEPPKETTILELVEQNNKIAFDILGQMRSIAGQETESVPTDKPLHPNILDNIIDDLMMLRRRLREASEMFEAGIANKIR